MLLRCHETACEGSRQTAGTDPDEDCRYCGQPLSDECGAILISGGALTSCFVCQFYGHVWEGMMIPGPPDRLRGACARCGQQIRV